MKPQLEKYVHWLGKAGLVVVFLGLFIAKEARAYGLPPLISVPPVGVTVQNGGKAQMTATIGLSLTPLTITWRFNGTNISNPNVVNATVPLANTTLSTLTITNCNAADAGKYSVYVQNSGGSITSGDGILVVLPISDVLNTVGFLSGTGMTNGGFNLQMLKPATSNCVVDASIDLQHWTPIYTNATSSTNISYLDGAATNMTYRYYRVRMQ